jgi:dihydrofolate reductase
MIITIIVAMDEEGGIGKNQKLPWHLPSDLKRFKALTMGHHLILGRKTFESIGKTLTGRTIVVITRQLDYRPEGCLVVSSLDGAIKLVNENGETEVFIGGGSEIFAQALPIANRIYLTRIETMVDADVYFPDTWNPALWKLISEESQPQSMGESLVYIFQVFERI